MLRKFLTSTLIIVMMMMIIIIIIVIVHPSFNDGLFSAQHMRATPTLLIAFSAHMKPLGLRFPVLVVLLPTKTWACKMCL